MNAVRFSVGNEIFAEHSEIKLINVKKGSAKAQIAVEEKTPRYQNDTGE